MSIHLYVSKRCPHSVKLLETVGSQEVKNHMDIINIDVKPILKTHKVTRIPTLIFGNDRHVGNKIYKWLDAYKKKNSTPAFFEQSTEEVSSDPFSYEQMKPKVSDEMNKRINMTVNEAYEAMNVTR